MYLGVPADDRLWPPAYGSLRSRFAVATEGIAVRSEGRNVGSPGRRSSAWSSPTKWWRPHPRLSLRKSRAIPVQTNWTVEPADADLLGAVVAAHIDGDLCGITAWKTTGSERRPDLGGTEMTTRPEVQIDELLASTAAEYVEAERAAAAEESREPSAVFSIQLPAETSNAVRAAADRAHPQPLGGDPPMGGRTKCRDKQRLARVGSNRARTVPAPDRRPTAGARRTARG